MTEVTVKNGGGENACELKKGVLKINVERKINKIDLLGHVM